MPEVNEFYRSQADNLKLPGELESNTLPLTNWVRFSKQQARYLQAKSDFINHWFKNGTHLSTDVIWDGNGTNHTAALTIFRHFDSASVVEVWWEKNRKLLGLLIMHCWNGFTICW